MANFYMESVTLGSLCPFVAGFSYIKDKYRSKCFGFRDDIFDFGEWSVWVITSQLFLKRRQSNMNIHYAVIGLTYFIILVIAYAVIIFTNSEEEKSELILDKAFKNAYSILAFGLLVVYGLFLLPHITLDYQTTSYLILASKFISVFTLGGTIFILNKKRCFWKY